MSEPSAGKAGRIESSCLCGTVAWEIQGPLERMTHCHCSMCRKEHGSAFGTYVGGAADTFRWLRGEDAIRRYRSSPEEDRAFCSRCGSVVAAAPYAGRVFMPAGNLDDDPGCRPVAHIFTGSKAPWHPIADAVPQFEEYAPGWDEPPFPVPEPPAPTRAGALRGSCLCGRVVYEVSGDMQGIVLCHCSRCRKSRSAAHATNLFFKNADFRFLSGQDEIDSYAVPDTEFRSSFCRTCGSITPRCEPDPSLLSVPAGALDTKAPEIEEKLHIYVGSKAPWYEIPPGLPQLDELVPTS